MVRVFVTVAAFMITMPLLVEGAPKMPNQSALEFMRRLQTTPQEGVFSEACVAACPAISGVLTGGAYKTHAENLQAKVAGMGQVEMMKQMGEMMSDMMMLAFDEVCANKDTFKCAADNAAACEDPSGHDQTLLFLTGFADTIKHMDCLCDSCPSLKQGYAGFQGTMMDVMMEALTSMGGCCTFEYSNCRQCNSGPTEEEMQAKVMKSMCSLATGLECANANENTCSGLFEGAQQWLWQQWGRYRHDSGSSGGGWGMTVNMNTEMLEDVEQLKQKCTAEGYALSPSANDLSISSARIAMQSVLSVCTAIAIHFVA